MKLIDIDALLGGIENLLVKSQRKSGHPNRLNVREYRASMLQGCMRKQYHNVLYPPDFDLTTRGKFKIGQNLHTEVQGWLEQLLGDRLVCEQFWIKDINNRIKLTGHTDCIIDDKLIIELKSIQSLNFVKSKPKDYHVGQLQNYLWLTGLDSGTILYIDKVNYRMKYFCVSRDEERIKNNLGWFFELDNFLVKEDLPPCCPVYSWECKNCGCVQCEKCNTEK